jgi:phage/plasmid-like protein (TIGR03299 family)
LRNGYVLDILSIPNEQEAMMAHEVETMFSSGGKVPWHRLGTVIEKNGASSAEALHLAGLDWKVYLEPVMRRGSRVLRKNHVVRDSDESVLGIVGDTFNPLQNVDAFRFGDDLVDSSGAHWDTAGSLYDGRKVWMLMKHPEPILPCGDRDEAIEQYILISNTHDGSERITVAVVDVRVVCQNTLSLAMRGAHRVYKVKHTKNMDGRLAEARKALNIMESYGAVLKANADQMMRDPFSLRDFDHLLDKLVPIPVEEGAPRTRATNMQERIRSVYRESENLENVRATRWGALNGIIEWSDHHFKMRRMPHTSEQDRHFERVVDGAPIVQRAFHLLGP